MTKLNLFSICAVLLLFLSKEAGFASEKDFLDTSGKGTAKTADEARQTVFPSKPPVKLSDNDNITFSVRCWQNGELIIEDSNWTVPQLSVHYIAMRKAGSPVPGLYLIDMQHTLCELKQKQ